MSLREDYLHYLLEFERVVDLDMINNNILDKKIRYTLGNLTPEYAKTLIKSLTEHGQMLLEPSLIEQMVNDLETEAGEIRPIELQILGHCLQSKGITTKDGYKSKSELMQGYLDEVISDCGKDNEDAALMVLYLLTEKNLRPLKTQSEIEGEIKKWEPELKVDVNQLELIFEILTGSGLLFVIPEKNADRFQLVHDYLVGMIFKKTEVYFDELERFKNDRIIAEQIKKQRERIRLYKEYEINRHYRK